MPVDIPLRCTCGTVRGVLQDVSPARVGRAICYCDDCQAFAHYLGRADDVLDEHGGTSVFQVSPSLVTIGAGAEQLACVCVTGRRRTPLRWYSDCCQTPIGNTLGSHELHFVGLIHRCMDFSSLDIPLDVALGPVRMHAFKRFAVGDATALGDAPASSLPLLFGLVRRMLAAKLGGAYKRTPFFDAATGKPAAEPHRLTNEERSRLPR